MDVQTLEQAGAQKAGSLVQTLGARLHVTRQQAEEHLGMGIVGRHLDALNGHHANTRVFQLARDQLGQITLDLIGDLEGTIGCGRLFMHGSGPIDHSVRATSRISKNSSTSPTWMSL